MIDLKPLISILKKISLIGMIATVVMMTAVVYRKLKEKYPEQVEKHRWVFVLVASLMVFIMFFLYQRFIASA